MKTRVVVESWVCDRCHEPMVPKRGCSYDTITLKIEHSTYDHNGNGAGATREVDLCDRCALAFLEFEAPTRKARQTS